MPWLNVFDWPVTSVGMFEGRPINSVEISTCLVVILLSVPFVALWLVMTYQGATNSGIRWGYWLIWLSGLWNWIIAVDLCVVKFCLCSTESNCGTSTWCTLEMRYAAQPSLQCSLHSPSPPACVLTMYIANAASCSLTVASVTKSEKKNGGGLCSVNVHYNFNG